MKSCEYQDYWVGSFEDRKRRHYYERLYGKLKSFLKVPNDLKIIDIGGGNGQFLNYLKVKEADLVDISDSGLQIAEKLGYRTIKYDIQKQFTFGENNYDVAYCFEVLEHLHYPNKVLINANCLLKKDGILFIGQPNMKADGIHHVRRYDFKELLADIKKSGFKIEKVDYVPAFTMRDAILSDIRKNRNYVIKIKQSIAFGLSYLPWKIRYIMARFIPNRFALMFVVKAIKVS